MSTVSIMLKMCNKNYEVVLHYSSDCRCTENYELSSAVISVLGVPFWWETNNPR